MSAFLLLTIVGLAAPIVAREVHESTSMADLDKELSAPEGAIAVFYAAWYACISCCMHLRRCIQVPPLQEAQAPFRGACPLLRQVSRTGLT